MINTLLSLAMSATLACGLSAAADGTATTSSDDDQKTEEAKPMQYVTMTTSLGEIVIELNTKKAPISVANFLSYVEDEHYDGTIFHRVISNFMIQGGGFNSEMRLKRTKAPIKNEWENGLKNVRGSIAMARTAVPDSATCQFFINVRDNPPLDMPQGGAAYAVFGKVVAGMDVVDKIRLVETTTRAGHSNVPREPVVIEKVRKISAEDAAKAIESEKEPAEQDSDA